MYQTSQAAPWRTLTHPNCVQHGGHVQSYRLLQGFQGGGGWMEPGICFQTSCRGRRPAQVQLKAETTPRGYGHINDKKNTHVIIVTLLLAKFGFPVTK